MGETGNDPRIERLRQLRDSVRQGGGPERIARQHAKGKLTARERLDLLLDASTFNELEPFTIGHDDPRLPGEQAASDPDAGALDLAADKYLGDGVVTGYGQIDGRTVYVYAQDFTIYGGTLSEMQSRKICRVMDLAVRNGAPIIGLIDSGGARIQEGVRSLGGYAEIFRRNCPVFGRHPADQRHARPVRGRRGLFARAHRPDHHGREAVVHVHHRAGSDQAVTGEVIDAGEPGRRRRAHGTSAARPTWQRRVEPGGAGAVPPAAWLPPVQQRREPALCRAHRRSACAWIDALNTIVPLDPASAYSMHEVHRPHRGLRRSFLEVQPPWARNAIVGLARHRRSQRRHRGAGAERHGRRDRHRRLRQDRPLCAHVRLLQHAAGHLRRLARLPARHRPGARRHHPPRRQDRYAYSEATVPKISVITRKAYGGAYIVMSSKYLGTDVTYAWPSAEIAVMGAEGAVNILFAKQIEAAADPAAERRRLVEEYRERFNNPYHAAHAGYIDDIIEPRETRHKIIAALDRAARQVCTRAAAQARQHAAVETARQWTQNLSARTPNHRDRHGAGLCVAHPALAADGGHGARDE